MLLAMAERRLGIADRLAACFPDRRDPMRVRHSLGDMIRARIPGDRLRLRRLRRPGFLRFDPAFKLACGRLPDTGADLLLAADAVAAGERALALRTRSG